MAFHFFPPSSFFANSPFRVFLPPVANFHEENSRVYFAHLVFRLRWWVPNSKRQILLLLLFLSIYCMGSGSCFCPKSQITSSPSPSRFSKNRWRFSFASGYPESHKRDKEGLGPLFCFRSWYRPCYGTFPFLHLCFRPIRGRGPSPSSPTETRRNFGTY